MALTLPLTGKKLLNAQIVATYSGGVAKMPVAGIRYLLNTMADIENATERSRATMRVLRVWKSKNPAVQHMIRPDRESLSIMGTQPPSPAPVTHTLGRLASALSTRAIAE